MQRADGTSKADPYDLKNASLDLSLYVAEQYSSGVWRAFARWLVQEKLPVPQRVLDLGCENGVISCLLASVWPEAQVVAVDRSGPAILAARKLATRLGLKNVTFEEAGARHFLTQNQNTFSIIVATLATHEVLKDPGGREPFQWNEAYVALEDIRLSQKDEYAISVLRQIRSSLTPNGLFISLDRSPTSATTWWYVQCLEEADLRVSLRYSYKIEAQSAYGIVEKFPLTMTTRADEGRRNTSAEEILSLASFPELSALSLTLKEDVADLFLRSLGRTQIMFEAVAKYVDNSGIRTIQLLKTPTILVLHDFTDHGHRTAFVAPLVALPELVGQCQNIVQELKGQAVVSASTTEAGEELLARLS